MSTTVPLQKIFPDAAAAASGKKLEEDSISSSDDSDDDDYDPDKPDKLESIEGENSRSEASKNVTTFSGNNMALPLDDSEDSEDDDFDPTAADPEEQVKPGSSSSDFSSDSEDLDGLIADSAEPCKDPVQISPLPDQMQGQSLRNELSCLIGTSEEPVSGRRHVERLDYKKLHDVSFLLWIYTSFCTGYIHFKITSFLFWIYNSIHPFALCMFILRYMDVELLILEYFFTLL